MRTLVLNAGFEPLGVVSDRRALNLVMNGKASVLDVDAQHPMFGVEGEWTRPVVILLTRYVKVPMARISPVTRRGVLRRDDHRCGYCDAFANTIDHIMPRSRGGAHSWENLVACCLRCNNVKGDRTPGEMGWRLRSAPRAPRGTFWNGRGLEREQPEWAAYLPAA